MFASIRSAVAPSPARTSVKSESARSSGVLRVVSEVAIAAAVIRGLLSCLAPNASTAVKPRNSGFSPAVSNALQGDRPAGTQQVRHDVVMEGRGALWPPVNEERPESLANGGRKHAFEVFERGTSKLLVVAVEASEGYLQRFPWE